MLSLAALLPLLALASAADRPDFCHELDCPAFTVLSTTDTYELRRYNSTKWVAVMKEAMALDMNTNSAMFRTLFHYISGNNSQGVKIPMTAPVLTTVAHGAGPNCASNFTMHFMLPHNNWAAPIAPTERGVFITTLPPMDVYVRHFGGFADGEDYRVEAMELASDLSAKDLPFSTAAYHQAGYDGPYTFFNRHNEVWLQKISA